MMPDWRNLGFKYISNSFDSERLSAYDKIFFSLGATKPDWRPENSTCEMVLGTKNIW